MAGIQKGLTWANENAHITLPTLSNDTFSLGAAASISPDAPGSESFLSDTSSKATDMITDVVVKLTMKWEGMLREEAIISACIIGVWVIVLLIAVVRTLVLFFMQDKHRGDLGMGNGPVPYNGSGRRGTRVSTSPVFPAFDAGSPARSSGGSPADEGYPNEKVDPQVPHWINTGSVNRTVGEYEGDYRRSVHASVHPNFTKG